jgi:hypothetical protein
LAIIVKAYAELYQQKAMEAVVRGGISGYCTICVTKNHGFLSRTLPWDIPPSKCKVLIPTAGNYNIDDKIELIGTKSFDGIWDILNAGSGWIEIDGSFTITGYLTMASILPVNTFLVNRAKTYTHEQWLIDKYYLWMFAWQAQDNAQLHGVLNNKTDIGVYRATKEPDDYIDYFDEKMSENES